MPYEPLTAVDGANFTHPTIDTIAGKKTWKQNTSGMKQGWSIIKQGQTQYRYESPMEGNVAHLPERERDRAGRDVLQALPQKWSIRSLVSLHRLFWGGTMLDIKYIRGAPCGCSLQVPAVMQDSLLHCHKSYSSSIIYHSSR